VQFVDLLGPVSAEPVQRFDDGQARSVEPAFDGALLASAVFALQQAPQIFDVGPFAACTAPISSADF
jgi:hypothetical protein